MDITKYVKKMEDIHKKNVQLDMESMQRFRDILEEVKDTDKAIQLDFLKEYLRLRHDDDSAIEELKIKINEIGAINYRSIIDETDQKIYISFSSEKEE
ncbi:MAG: hypothetical protein ACFFDR_06995 [Candidatus Thorarchaeota archaeon]